MCDMLLAWVGAALTNFSQKSVRKISSSFFVDFSPFQQSYSDQTRLLSLIGSEFEAFIRQHRLYSVFKYLKIVHHFLIRKWAFRTTRARQTRMVGVNH